MRIDQKDYQVPNFYGVTPSFVLLDHGLSFFDRWLLTIISTLTNYKGYCWASNSYLGFLANRDVRTIQRSISALANRGYITVHIEPEKLNTRVILLGYNPHDKNVMAPPDKNVTPPVFSKEKTDNKIVYNNSVIQPVKSGIRYEKRPARPDITLEWFDDYLKSLDE